MDNYIKAGQIFANRYKIIEIIGEGATSYVYLAYDNIQEMNVSLKVLKNDNIDEKKIRNFEREAKAISLLNHPNIIKIYEFSEYEGYHYICQEYVEGITIKEYIHNSNKIHIKDVVDISIQVLEGLKHAHEHKVIHKDIKSQNILYSVNKEIKITDFGIADILDDNSAKTQSLMGTPQYIAPEVLSRMGSNEQTDIYALGIMIYELLVGHAPFYGEKSTVIMLKQLNQPLPSVIKERSDVPQSLENIMIKASAKKLDNRYKTADEMLEDLHNCLNINNRNVEPLILENDFDIKTETTLDIPEIITEKNNQQKKEDKRKRNILILILLFILTLIVILLAFLFTPNNKIMPDIVNLEYTKAESILTDIGINKDKIKIEYEKNNEITTDTIISSEPKAGDSITKDTNITLTVSQGPEDIEVPSVVEQSQSVGTSQLESLGFKVKINKVNSSEYSGTIIEQNPFPGEKISYGSTITITVSDGVKIIKMQNFIGLKEKEIDKWAEENNINVTKDKSCSDNYAEGIIYKQNPAYNKDIEENSSVKISISNGSCKKENTDSNTNTTNSTDNEVDNTKKDN